MLEELGAAIVTSLWMVVGITAIMGLYVVISFVCSFGYYMVTRNRQTEDGTRKTVTFGDESSVVANRFASVAAVLSVFILWGLATGSALLGPIQLPGPFTGQTQFEYTATAPDGATDTATVFVTVTAFEDKDTDALELTDLGEGFAKDDSVKIPERRSEIVRAIRNDDGGDVEGYRITHVNGTPIATEETVSFEDGEVFLTRRGSLSIKPATGITMEALFLPPPEQVWSRFIDLNINGYQNVGLWENVFWSLFRVIVGFALGCLFGIPLGFAMGLNSWLRGWFDPIVEFMRPVPPLALIPLIIIWFGIGEQGKISLLFLAALWIMTIAARAGVAGTNISKVHAAYSLGASKTQLLRQVILPNSLPEIFTGARVAMGVCWGTVVAAELVAAETGAGKMIIAASKFQLTDIVIVGIILIGVIGFGIDILMRKAEERLVPWKGHS